MNYTKKIRLKQNRFSASTTIYKDDEKLPNENELAVFESAYREPLPEVDFS